MFARVRVLCGMTIRRVVTAERRGARLTRPQMDPLCADLHALFALTPLRMFDSLNRSYVRAAFPSHHCLLHSASTRLIIMPYLPNRWVTVSYFTRTLIAVL